MSRRSIIFVIVAPGLGPLFALIPCFIGFLLLFLFFFAVFFLLLYLLYSFPYFRCFLMLELVMKKYVVSCEGKCKKKSGQKYRDEC